VDGWMGSETYLRYSSWGSVFWRGGLGVRCLTIYNGQRYVWGKGLEWMDADESAGRIVTWRFRVRVWTWWW